MTSNVLVSLISSSYTPRAIYRPVFAACSHLQLISFDFDLSQPLASHPDEQGSLSGGDAQQFHKPECKYESVAIQMA